MAKKDIEILNSVSQKWALGAGASISVATVLKMLSEILQRYGEDFSIQKVCDALQKLSDDALAIKKDLDKALFEKEQKEEKMAIGIIKSIGTKDRYYPFKEDLIGQRVGFDPAKAIPHRGGYREGWFHLAEEIDSTGFKKSKGDSIYFGYVKVEIVKK